MIEDFDEFRDSLADYNDTSGGVFVDAVPITNTKKTVRNEGGGEGRPSDFELAEDINKVQRLR